MTTFNRASKAGEKRENRRRWPARRPAASGKILAEGADVPFRRQSEAWVIPTCKRRTT
jgi:hypothetical protein